MAVLTVGVMADVAESAVLDIRVTAGSDDAEEHTDAGENGRMENWSSTDLELGREDDFPDQQLCGMRFNNITIPNRARISNAYLEFTVDEADSGQMSLAILGALTPDVPNTFDNTDYELSSLPRTSAEAYWIDIPAWSTAGNTYQTPDISSVISEIVGQAGWVNGNSLVLMVEAYAGSTGCRTAEAFDGDAAGAPRLYVEYMPGTAWDPTPINNGWALIDLPLLEWEMPDPLVGGDTLSVNVYFGTDPNLIVGVNGTVQPETGTAVVNTGNFGRPLTLNQDYYWRVDIIDPNGGFGAPIITGNTWTFTTTIPAEVIVTETAGATEVSEEGPTSDTYTISLSKVPESGESVTVTIGPPAGISVPIAASGDDAEEDQASGSISRSSSDLEMPFDGGTEQIIGLWFADLQIPVGATITSAAVDFLADGGSSVDCYLTISGRLDDPGSFQQDINWMISTPGVDDETTAEVEWTPESWSDDTVYSTPDISAIIQEIVGQASWSAGNNLAITIRNGNSGGTTVSGERRRSESWNGSAAGGNEPAPVLRVEFDAGGQVTLSQDVVVLDSTNWEGVVVTVTAVDDSLLEPDPHTITLENVVTSVDEAWNGLQADDVVVTIAENECGAWGFHPLDLNYDCDVDIGDLAVFAADFGGCTEPFNPNCTNLSN